MLLVTHWTPGKQIVGGILPPRGSSFEQSDELAEVIALLRSAPDDLFEAIEIHPKINDSKRDEPGILEPLQPSLL